MARPRGLEGYSYPRQLRFFTDHLGRSWKIPECNGRLKMSIPSHRALRSFILARDGSCKQCGRNEDLVADHIISRRNGGDHHPDNLQALCQSCNSRKSGLIDAKGVPSGG